MIEKLSPTLRMLVFYWNTSGDLLLCDGQEAVDHLHSLWDDACPWQWDNRKWNKNEGQWPLFANQKRRLLLWAKCVWERHYCQLCFQYFSWSQMQSHFLLLICKLGLVPALLSKTSGRWNKTIWFAVAFFRIDKKLWYTIYHIYNSGSGLCRFGFHHLHLKFEKQWMYPTPLFYW